MRDYRNEKMMELTEQQQKWDRRFLRLISNEIASWSKDPRHQVACVIVDDDRQQLSGGYNGFPRGIADDHRLHDKTKTIEESEKLPRIVHAEANAVAAAAKKGHALAGGTCYATRPVCCSCAGLLIQAGIKRVVYLRQSVQEQGRWAGNFALAFDMLQEAKIQVVGYFSADGE